MRKSLMLVIIGSLLAIAGNAFSQGNAVSCDRACLEGFVEKYFDAAIAHDPKLLPLSPDVKFTENGQRLPLPRSPYGMNSGWSSWKDGLSSAARDLTK